MELPAHPCDRGSASQQTEGLHITVITEPPANKWIEALNTIVIVELLTNKQIEAMFTTGIGEPAANRVKACTQF